MPTINLPTEAERAAVDVDSFTWSNSEPGALTKPHGALLKLIIDQLESGEGVQVISPGRGTGKTPKFIVQNTTNGANLKVVMRDDFSEAKTDDGSGHGNNTTRSNVKVLLGSIDNVYLQDMAGVITFESDNTTVNYTNTQTSTNIETVDTSVTPTTFDSMTDEEIATEIAKPSRDFHTKEVLLNKDDEKLDGGGSDKFAPDVILVCPQQSLSMDFLGYSGDAAVRGEAWLKREVSIGVTRLFNKLPVGGVLIYDKIHFERINGAIQDALGKLDPATYDSCLYNNTESDYTGAYQSMAIKKLS